MKLTTFFRLSVSFFLVVASVGQASACGPYAPVIPTPDFFGLTGLHKPMSYYERDENLILWQSLTSKRIPLADIEEVVYHDSWNRYHGYVGYHHTKTDNLFYAYLNNSGDDEITNFLSIAKQLEEHWRNMRSPWYYPRNRNSNYEIGHFNELIELCKAYNGVRLKDRYALQISRAFFASRQYAACIEYYDSAFSDIPDCNLMKRMAQRYVAGSWSRLGEKRWADIVFAKAGDVWSVSASNPAEYMAIHNPNAPQLMEYIRSRSSDVQFMLDMNPVARRLLKDPRVKNKGDWNFLLAYINNEFNHNASLARKEIYKAMRLSFSTDELKSLARVYKMKLDGQAGKPQALLSDLKWLESKIDVLNPEAQEWVRRCRNIIYVDWVPKLWEKKDYSTAILLCSYADNMAHFGQWYGRANMWWKPSRSVSIEEMRNSEKYVNRIDYGCLSFQMMGSLSSERLIAACRCMLSDKPLYRFLRRKAYTNKDYYNELIGTLALREENYIRAVNYLSRVNTHYLRTMNIYKGGYLSRDPFIPYKSRREEARYESQAGGHLPSSNAGAKLKFARKMLSYKQTMKYGRSANARGLARLMYAIGRRNSFEECWALTQYWCGSWVGIFEPSLYEGEDDWVARRYGFLYDYESAKGHEATEKLYRREVAASFAMLTTDEARAKANYIMGNLATVVRYYGKTPTARWVKASCDNWKSWL